MIPAATPPYAANSLLPLAGELSRPLLLVHGLADDNVVAAHTLQLSSALLSAGKPHEVLPLVGVTHMTPQEVVAENLLLHQLDFLQRSLGLREPLGSAVMNQRLKDLYSHVSVHATANREHEAAVELLLLVMMADRHISTDEVETIRSISDDSGWETDTFSFDQYIGPASAKVRAPRRARRRCAARRHRRSCRQHGAALGSVQRCARWPAPTTSSTPTRRACWVRSPPASTEPALAVPGAQ